MTKGDISTALQQIQGQILSLQQQQQAAMNMGQQPGGM